MKLDEHPTVIQVRTRPPAPPTERPTMLKAE